MSPAEIIYEEERRVTATETLRAARERLLHTWIAAGQIEHTQASYMDGVRVSKYRVKGGTVWFSDCLPCTKDFPSEKLIANLALGVAALCPFVDAPTTMTYYPELWSSALDKKLRASHMLEMIKVT